MDKTFISQAESSEQRFRWVLFTLLFRKIVIFMFVNKLKPLKRDHLNVLSSINYGSVCYQMLYKVILSYFISMGASLGKLTFHTFAYKTLVGSRYY